MATNQTREEKDRTRPASTYTMHSCISLCVQQLSLQADPVAHLPIPVANYFVPDAYQVAKAIGSNGPLEEGPESRDRLPGNNPGEENKVVAG